MDGTLSSASDPTVSVKEILEAFADRATIEQDFHDVKEVWGSGQQQVRNIWNNLAVYNLNLWMHTMVELWAWDKNRRQLVDRSDSPWDDAERRPSHANRRKALREQILRNELSTITTDVVAPTKNHSTNRKPHGIGRLTGITSISFQKVHQPFLWHCDQDVLLENQ